ncbi:MAG: DUF4294 domain-containing protein [Crocinitomicaceae bacterium]
MKKFALILCLFLSSSLFAQNEDTTLNAIYYKPIEVVDVDFLKQYKYLKPRVIKVYPYASYAANVLDEIENDLVSIERRRKRNKHCKLSYKQLKKDFKYAMLDLYVSEGKVLMDLVARETGSSVYDIVKKYRGSDDAMVFNLMGKMFEQDIKKKYKKKDNYVLEYILKEIEDGKIQIDSRPKLITKADFKAEEKRLKANRKKYKALRKERDKLAKKIKRKKRKANKIKV